MSAAIGSHATRWRVTARLEGDVEIGDRVVFDGVLDERDELAPVFRAD